MHMYVRMYIVLRSDSRFAKYPGLLLPPPPPLLSDACSCKEGYQCKCVKQDYIVHTYFDTYVRTYVHLSVVPSARTYVLICGRYVCM